MIKQQMAAQEQQLQHDRLEAKLGPAFEIEFADPMLGLYLESSLPSCGTFLACLFVNACMTVVPQCVVQHTLCVQTPQVER